MKAEGDCGGDQGGDKALRRQDIVSARAHYEERSNSLLRTCASWNRRPRLDLTIGCNRLSTRPRAADPRHRSRQRDRQLRQGVSSNCRLANTTCEELHARALVRDSMFEAHNDLAWLLLRRVPTRKPSNISALAISMNDHAYELWDTLGRS